MAAGVAAGVLLLWSPVWGAEGGGGGTDAMHSYYSAAAASELAVSAVASNSSVESILAHQLARRCALLLSEFHF
jgi:hypothetical protein